MKSIQWQNLLGQLLETQIQLSFFFFLFTFWTHVLEVFLIATELLYILHDMMKF